MFISQHQHLFKVKDALGSIRSPWTVVGEDGSLDQELDWDCICLVAKTVAGVNCLNFLSKVSSSFFTNCYTSWVLGQGQG